MPLNERDRIEILMMIGVGDRMRTQQEVCRLFHEMHPDREPVSQSTVSRIERKYRELGHVRDAPRQGRPKINENVQQDVILSALENPHCTVRQVSRDLNIGKSSVSNIFKKRLSRRSILVLSGGWCEGNPKRTDRPWAALLHRN
ncbi:hypothetical protein NQ318_000691 [Aromia moschata]|uniref:Transposase Tc1-like domain-containing protein n=1 Tax=Aromia moschata TaxID=1265417 RepID=A0AAV8XDE6_9CUCU|nr:hypothetical protein NQ318_000691 [Aromia moschata]